MIRLAFVVAAKTGSVWSYIISKASGSPYSHVELWFSGPIEAAYCFSSREPHGASFMTRDLRGDGWKILDVPDDAARYMRAIAFCQGANGKAYDALGLVGYKLGTGQHDDHDVFCSEVVSACLETSELLTLPKDPWLISPGDLEQTAEAQEK